MSESAENKTRLWLVQGPDVTSGELFKSLSPGEVHRKVDNDLLVLSMTQARVEQVMSKFPGLIVEPDSGLSLF
jgi:hypothetical protein